MLQRQQDPAIGSILEGERLTLDAHRRALEDSLKTLRDQRRLLEERAASLEEQVRLAKVQSGSIDQEMEGVRILVEKQLAPTSRLLDLSRTEAIIAGNRLALESDLLRTRQGVAQTDQLIANAINDRRSQALQDHQEVLSSVREFVTKRETAANVAARQTSATRFDAGAMANEVDVVLSDAVVTSVVKSLNLEDDASFLERADLADSASEEEKIQAASEKSPRNLWK